MADTMAVYNLKEGTLGDREKLLKSDRDPEEAAEELGIEIEKFEDTEELQGYLEDNFKQSEGVKNAQKLAKMAAMHLKPAVDDLEDRVLYTEL